MVNNMSRNRESCFVPHCESFGNVHFAEKNYKRFTFPTAKLHYCNHTSRGPWCVQYHQTSLNVYCPIYLPFLNARYLRGVLGIYFMSNRQESLKILSNAIIVEVNLIFQTWASRDIFFRFQNCFQQSLSRLSKEV